MRKLRNSILLVIIVSLLTGCGELPIASGMAVTLFQKTDNADATIIETSIKEVVETNEYVEHMPKNTKIYIQKTDAEEFIPQIIMDEEYKTFSFSYDVLSSYLAVGTYAEKNGKLELKTDDGKYCYIFDIADDNILKFNQENSSDSHPFGTEMENGTEFVIDSN